jgi:hypothetical protein
MRNRPDTLRRLVPAALACALAAALTAAAGVAGGALTEPSTKVEFAFQRNAPGAAGPLELTGVGVRKKVIFKVYGFALYVDPKAAREALARWAGKTPDVLRADPEFYRALTDLAGERLAVLHFVMSVDAGRMREAMADAMDRGVPKDDPARAAFLALWKQPMQSAEEVLIFFGADGAVTLSRHGEAVGSVKSAALARSLLQAWLGPDPISEDIRRGVVARIPDILAPR